MDWHLHDVEDVLAELRTSPESGLSQSEADMRMYRDGTNELIEKGGRTPLKILWEQVTATMVLILIAAAIIAGFLGDWKNTIAISAIVILYALLGFIQEFRAEQAISALKRLSVPMVRVLRDGGIREVSARLLVSGDIVELEAGNVLPADIRLMEAVNLTIQESALTGESVPVQKQTEALVDIRLTLADRRNMAYMGTVVTQGRGRGGVVATGMRTELGRIADLIQQSGAGQTPLQKRLDTLGKNLAILGILIAAIIAVIGILRGDELQHMLLTAVSIAVAIVPEGLPAVVTITLALGAQRMLRLNALIRKLPAVETLGSVTVICSDKTGTLTENRMRVMVLETADGMMDLGSDIPHGDGSAAFQLESGAVPFAASLAAIGGALCNDARVTGEGDSGFHILGDPTEGALIVCAARLGYEKISLEKHFPRMAEWPFDSDRKRMTTVHALGQHDPRMLAGLDNDDHPYIAFTKGGVDGLLDVSTHIWMNGHPHILENRFRIDIESMQERLAKKGMRVLGLAFRVLDTIPEEIGPDIEQGLTFVGLFGMIDPPRSEVFDAVSMTKTAGIRPVMITGDHPQTALEIGRQLGITETGRVMTGIELESLPFEDLKNRVEDVQVFARVSPEHKLKIVRALQENGHIVAMTGDGVNDAPALKRADIGVAMGITGTDVSKEAADMVLLDDNFATIVAAVKEGRTIYDNIRKFVRFSVAGNIGKVLVMLLAPFIGKPIPLLPLQLLWLNLLTDGLLGLGIGVESPEPDTMNRPPFSPKEGVFSRGGGMQVIRVGVLIGILALGLGAWYYYDGRPEWQTMVFTFLAFAQVFQAMASRSDRKSLFRMRVFGNRLLTAMVLGVVLLQLMVIYVPFMREFFDVVPLKGMDLSIAVGTAAIVLVVMEAEKRMRKRS